MATTAPDIDRDTRLRMYRTMVECRYFEVRAQELFFEGLVRGHDPPGRRPGGRRGRRRRGDARRRLHVLHLSRPQPHARPGRADGADLRRAVRARDRAPRRQGRLDAPDQSSSTARWARTPSSAPTCRSRWERPGRRSTAGRARSPSASSATGRPTSGRSTRRSTWPRSGRRRSCSCARTTSTWSTRRSATVTAVEHPAADRASAYGLASILVDGNDVDAVHEVARTADRPGARRRRAVAHRGADLPPRRPLAGRPRQVPAGRRGGRLEGARPDPRLPGPARGGRRGRRRRSTPSRPRRTTRSPPPRPRRAPPPSRPRTCSRPRSGATGARHGGTDVSRGHRPRHRPGDAARPDRSCSSARTSGRPVACSS